MRRFLWWSYLALLHIALVLALVKSNFGFKVLKHLGFPNWQAEASAVFEPMLNYHLRMDGNVPAGSVIFIGDSLTQGLAVTAIANPSVNYGIGGDTTLGVMYRLTRYQSIQTARAVVVAIGTNDLKFRSDQDILKNWQAIAATIPQQVPVLYSAILPVGANLSGQNRRIQALNTALKAWTQGSNRLFFADASPHLVDQSGNLNPIFHNGDGLHLNSKGNALWIKTLQQAIANLPKP